MQTTQESSDEMMLIERFASEDSHKASEAFAALAPNIRAVIHRLLATSLPRGVDREDAAEVVLQRLWQNRLRFEPRSVAAWWRYVSTTARRCALDHRLPEVPGEIHYVVANQSLMTSWMEPKRLYEGADELWLKVNPKLSRREHSRRLLAAQLFILGGHSRKKVAELLGVSTESIDRWIRCDSVLLRLGYSHLYVGNDRLVSSLLSVSGGSKGLDSLTVRARERDGEPPAEWTWTDAQIVILRFRNGLPETKVAQMLGIDVGEVERVVQACVARFHFLKRSCELSQKLRKKRLRFDVLSSIDLWRRLAFQYHVSDALPQRQILERTSDAAGELGYPLNGGVLNSWLSNRRVLIQLVDYLRLEEG